MEVISSLFGLDVISSLFGQGIIIPWFGIGGYFSILMSGVVL
jgi:hypothetical protein